MEVYYLVFILFSANPTDGISLNITGGYSLAHCNFLKEIIPKDPKQVVVCTTLREI